MPDSLLGTPPPRNARPRSGARDEARRIDLPDAELVLYDGVFPPEECEPLLDALRDEIAWEQHRVTVFGRTLPAPRLSAWYGDPGAGYRYSGVSLEPRAWTPVLERIRRCVEQRVSERFNSVLLNLYRDGRDSVGWHSDDEPSLGPEPVIASVSLGAVRRFALRHRTRGIRETLELPNGSVLLMSGPTQRCWMHQVPKTRAAVGPRVNLTFRQIRVRA